MEIVQTSTLVKGKTAKETIVVSVVKTMMFIFDQGVNDVVLLDKVRKGMITVDRRKFAEVIQTETSGCHRMVCPFRIWSLLPGMLQDVYIS